jgi:glycosyltransferase involved in cell wall biosynthesis
MTKPHILMLGTSLAAPGGMTSVVRTLRAAGLFATYNITYVSTYEKKGLVTQLRVMLVATSFLLGRLLSGGLSLVHAHSASRGSFWRKSFLCALARTFGVPYVFHIHSGEFPVFFEKECGAAARWWVRKTLQKASAVVCLSESWQAQIGAIAPGAKTLVIGNPVLVPTHLTDVRDPARRVLFLGRLREKKGVFDLIRALPEVQRHFPALCFVLAGDEGEAEVRALAGQLGVMEMIQLPGWVDGEEKQQLLKSADVFVLPSYFEGLPVGLLEAMATGVPVVATPVGGVPDVVDDGVHGLLVTPGDVPGLAAALLRLGADSKLRLALRDAAYQRVLCCYSVPVVLEQFAQLYADLLTATTISHCAERNAE